MAVKKYTKKEAFPFSWEGLNAWSYSSKNNLSSGSAIVIEVDGNHGEVMSKVSDRIYYVIEGNGKFMNGNKKIGVETGDVIIVDKNTPYDYKGKMKLFLVHIPAWDESQEVILEKK
jgi:mannose-6-phosphate isomerase-like protein (cupin superfamily)